MNKSPLGYEDGEVAPAMNERGMLPSSTVQRLLAEAREITAIRAASLRTIRGSRWLTTPGAKLQGAK